MIMQYPKCSNGSCSYNYEYLCKAEGMEEDIICKEGKAGNLTTVKNTNS